MNEESEQVNEPEQMSKALDAIHDEALKLLQHEGLPDEVEEGLDLILSIARYKFDVRTDEEMADGSETD